MKMPFTIVFVAAVLPVAVGVSEAQMNDFFPLRTGVERRYSYFREEASYKSPVYPETHDDYTKDSGSVVYTFRDSSIQNDTTTVWTIREVFRITTMQWHLDSLGLRDTTFSERTDSSDYPLFEYTSGFHKLFTNMMVLKLYGDVYRFSDTSTDTVVYILGDAYGDGIANTFKRDVGLFSMFSEVSSVGNLSYFKLKKEVRLLDSTTPVIPEDLSIHDFVLCQNYPNPFNSATTIEYSLPYPAHVTLEILSSVGQTVYLSDRGAQSAGHYSLHWDATPFSSGVYFLRLVADGRSHSMKMLLLK